MLSIRGLILWCLSWIVAQLFPKLAITSKAARAMQAARVTELERALNLERDRAKVNAEGSRQRVAAAEDEASKWGRKSDRLVDALDKIKESRTHSHALALAACALRDSRLPEVLERGAISKIQISGKVRL